MITDDEFHATIPQEWCNEDDEGFAWARGHALRQRGDRIAFTSWIGDGAVATGLGFRWRGRESWDEHYIESEFGSPETVEELAAWKVVADAWLAAAPAVEAAK